MTLDAIAKRYSIEFRKISAPTDQDVVAVVTERVTSLLEAKLRDRDKLKTERSQRFVPLGRSLAESEDESALIAMLLDDYYQQTLHAPALPTSQVREASKPKTSQPAPRGTPCTGEGV